MRMISRCLAVVTLSVSLVGCGRYTVFRHSTMAKQLLRYDEVVFLPRPDLWRCQLASMDGRQLCSVCRHHSRDHEPVRVDDREVTVAPTEQLLKCPQQVGIIPR